MDAAHNLLKKTVLFLATALLIAVPGRAQTLVPSSTTVGLSGNQAQSITLSSTGANLSYTVTAQPFWVNVVSSNNFTTPDTLAFQINTTNCGTLPCQGTAILHPANSSGDVTITVTYNNTGGGGTGTITASPSSVTLSVAATGQITSQNVLLSATGTTIISQITPSQSWLTGSVNTQAVSGPNSSILTITANSTGLGVGSYPATITLTPTTGTQTQIGVTFNVGSGTSGTIQVSQNTFQFAYPTGTQQAFVNVSSTNSNLTQFTFQVNSTGNWLNFDNTTSGAAFFSNGHTIAVNANAAAALAATTYQGTITLFNPTNSADTTTINVSLIVNGGGGGGGGGTFSVTPSSPASLNFTATPGSASQSQNLVITAPANSTVQVNGTVFNSGFLTVSSPSCVGSGSFTCSFTGSQTLAITVNPQNLVVAPYNATISVQSGGSSASVDVHLNVVSSFTQLTVSPGAATFLATTGGAGQSQALQVSVPSNDFIQATITQSSFGSFFTLSPFCAGLSTCSFNGSQSLTVTATPGNLAAGTYTGSILFQSGGTSVTVPVNLIVLGTGGGGGGGNTSGIASPTSLAFAFQIGKDANLPPQVITVGASGTFSVNTSVNTTQQWLVAAAQSVTGPNRVTVTVSPSGLAAGTYQGTVAINSSAGTQNVIVTLLVTANMVIEVNPGTYSFFYTAGSGTFSPQFLASTSDGTAANVNVSSATSWITVPIQSVSGTSATFSVTLNPTGLCNGLNTGTFTVTAANAVNSPVTVPVVLFVTGSTVTTGCNSGGSTGPLTFSSSSLTFNAQVNGSSPNSQTLGVTVPAGSSFFTVSATVQTGGTNWLSVSPSGGLSGSQNLVVSVNQSNLGVGTYNGTIAFNTNGSIQSVPVTLVVSTSGTGILNLSATTLNFTFTPGGSVPATQALNVTSATGTNTTFTYSATSTGNFVSATANSTTLVNGQVLTTPANLTISANPAGLNPGQTYTGTITLTPNGGTPVTITVNLTISNASVLTVNSSSLTPFTYNAGDSAPSPQTVTVSGAQGLTFTAAASSTGNWLSVSPTSGTIGSSPATLTISVNPTGLNAGSYTGTVTVTGTGTATGSTPISVSLTVNAPRPTITSVASAASYIGGSISPGEVITIFGTSIGPTPGVSLALDSSGKVATTLGGVQVLINGFLSPMVYASNTQVSAVVPYEVAGGPGTIGQVVVKFLGQSSNGIGTPVASTAPGIFTANASGSGPGAILNANSSANSPANPANRGDTIAIYLTGEGLTSPSGVTGRVTTVSPTPPLTPVPLLPVGALIDGAPANISFAGEAPGLVSGVMQLNVQIPPGTKSGPLSLVVSIGGVSSQAGVTVSVR